VTWDLRLKTRIFTAIVVLANVFGNSLMTFGVRRHGSALGSSALEYLRVMFHPYVAAGICLLIVWMLARMALLSWADLSYVLPVTAIGYVLVALVGHVFLAEQIPLKRWAGIVLIVAGVAMVSLGSAPRTHTLKSDLATDGHE